MQKIALFAKPCILILLASCIMLGAELTEKQMSKLHPFFQSVIAKSFPQHLKTSTVGNRMVSTSVSQDTSLYKAIIYTQDAATLRSMGIQINSVLPDFVTVQLTADNIRQLTKLESVKYLDPGSRSYPQLEVSVPETGASLLHSGFINRTMYKGSGAIVLIYDTGIDWKHMDFRKSDTTKSRILCIWDQTLTKSGIETSPSGFNYGVEYTQTQIEDELDGSPAGFVREEDIFGHGTHVASIAAGDGSSYNNKYIGMAPEADIIVVKGGDNDFNETDMIDALTYAQNKARVYGKPIVVNWSIGGHDGPHDGTRPYEVAVDNFVSTPGRVVCISAGNSGAHSIHVSGNVTENSPAAISIIVSDYTPNGGFNDDYFYLPIWLDDSLSVTASLTSPSGITYTCAANTSMTAPSTAEGTIEVANYVSFMNHHRTIEVYVHDETTDVPTAGTWTITLTMPSGSMTYDGWSGFSVLGNTNITLPAGDTRKTVCMPGTSREAITTGAYSSKWYWYSYDNTGAWNYGTDRTDNIATFSSIGPTADGRQKPDIAAPGQIVVAALSSSADTTGSAPDIVPGQKHQVMQGTSMSCPHVTGGTALLLGANPSLTAAQIKEYFTSTANSDSFTSEIPNYIWGYGKFDVLEAMAKSIAGGSTVTRTILAYDITSSSNIARITGTQKAAVKFSSITDGTLTGIQVYITSLPNRPIIGSGPLVCDVYTDNAGFPGIKIGGSVNQPFSLLTPFTNNYIQMTSANISIASETDYHVVLSVANATDTVIVRCDNSTDGTHSSSYSSSGWSAQSYNLRIRPIVTSTIGLPIIDDTSSQQPQAYMLAQNYPNPFNSTTKTKIKYDIPIAGKVTLKVFNLLGQVVATLVDESQEANTYVKEFDASRMSSGTYFYRISAGSFNDTKKMILIK